MDRHSPPCAPPVRRRRNRILAGAALGPARMSLADLITATGPLLSRDGWDPSLIRWRRSEPLWAGPRAEPDGGADTTRPMPSAGGPRPPWLIRGIAARHRCALSGPRRRCRRRHTRNAASLPRPRDGGRPRRSPPIVTVNSH